MEHGVVIEADGDRILVEAGPGSCCTGCAAGNACAIADGGKRRLWMKNDRGARPGDSVTFVIEARAVVLSSFILYFFPVAALMAGLVIGTVNQGLFGLGRDASSVLWGCILLFFSFFCIRVLSHLLKKKTFFDPRLIDVAEKDK